MNVTNFQITDNNGQITNLGDGKLCIEPTYTDDEYTEILKDVIYKTLKCESYMDTLITIQNDIDYTQILGERE